MIGILTEMEVRANIGWSCADYIQKRTGRDVFMVTVWRVGSSILEWLPGGALYDKYIADITAAWSSPEIGSRPADIAIWMQGETDAAMDTGVYLNNWEAVYAEAESTWNSDRFTQWAVCEFVQELMQGNAGFNIKNIPNTFHEYVQGISSYNFFETDGLGHFDGDALEVMGVACGRQFSAGPVTKATLTDSVTVENRGTGVRVALPKEGSTLPYRTLIPGVSINFELTAQDEIIINAEGIIPLCEGGTDPACLEYGVSTPVVNSTEIYNDTAWGNWPTAMKSGIINDGVIAVNGDVIFQSTATSNSTRPAGPLFVSTDFGDNWVAATNPVDTIWQDLDLDEFNTQYPDNLGHWGMQFVDGNFISLYGTWDLKIAASFVSSDNGQTWNLIYSSKRLAVTTQNPYTGVYSKLGRSPGNLTINGIQPIFAGETSKSPAIQRGGWDTYGTEADSSPLYLLSQNWSQDYNYIAPMSPSYYVMVGQDNPGVVHLFDEAETPRMEYSAPYWTGTQWNADYVGDWLRNQPSNPNRNTLTYTSFDVSNGGGSTDGKHFVIPRTNWANFGSANAGLYRILTTPDVGGTGTKPDFLGLDLNPYLVTEPEDTTLYSLYLVYDKVFGGWLLLYSFRNPFAPKHFYMRAFHDPTNIVMSDVVKVVLPQPILPEEVEMGYDDFGLAIKYSDTQDSFVISTLMTSSPSGYTLRTSKFANPFFCSLFEPVGFNPSHDDILQYDSVEQAWCHRPTLLSLVEAGYGGISWGAGPVDFPAASPGNVIDANWYTLFTDTLSVATPVNITQNIANDSLALAKDGVWTLSISMTFGHNSDASGARNVGLRLYNVTDATVIATIPLTVGRNAEVTPYSISRLFELPAESVGDEVVVQIGGGDTLTGVQLYTFSYSLTRQNAYTGT
jgi:hypothetical protein